MGKRPWSALVVYLGFAGSAQALPITLSLPIAITSLSQWESNPYSPPSDLAVGDVGTITYAFEKDDIVVESLSASEAVVSVAPWSFQGSFPGAALPGTGNGGFAVLRIRMTDGAVDTLLVDAVEDDFSSTPCCSSILRARPSPPRTWLRLPCASRPSTPASSRERPGA